MKQETLSGVRCFKGNSGREIRMEYYFLKDYRFGDEETPLCGIKVIKWESDGVERFQEEETAPAISYSEKFVKQIIHAMIKNLVTPVHMLEIIDDFVTLAPVLSGGLTGLEGCH